ncbi:cation:proton antiporter [Thermodesulfobacteriota bacterium]
MEQIFAYLSTFKDSVHPMLYIGFLLLASYAGGHIANYFKAPRVIGYLIVGMLLSPSVSGLLNENLVQIELGIITHIALAIIAFSIGGTFELTRLKRIGKQIFWITSMEATGAFLLATLSLCTYFTFIQPVSTNGLGPFWNSYFPVALVIGAICAATAPAATLAIVHEYRAKGPLTSMLLGVVALDDAVAIFLYAFALSIANSFINLKGISIYNFLVLPCFSILISLAIGTALGVCIKKLIYFVPRREAMQGVMLGCIFLTGGLTINLAGHPLLANMMFGFMVVNFVQHHEDLFEVVERIEEPIFGMFFALAGAHLDFSMIQTAGLLALVISFGRFSGKILGARLGTQISGAPEKTKKYLGFMLLPTAGVTVGLILEAEDVFGQGPFYEMMVSGVLGSVIINELLTPFIVRFSLFKAGEAVRAQES